MLVNLYPQDQYYSSASSIENFHLKSIKQAFNQEDSYDVSPLNIRHRNLSLSLKMKGFVIRGLLCKNGLWDYQRFRKQKQIAFYRWYAMSSNRFQFAINKFLTSGRIRKEKVFYMLKIMAKNIISNKKEDPGLNKQKKQQNMSQITTINHKEQQNRPKTMKKQLVISTKYQSSINHILIQSENILSDTEGQAQDNQIKKEFVGHQQCKQMIKQQDKLCLQTSKNKNSISYIQPASGPLEIQLISCTNILFQQKPQKQQHKKTQKLSSVIQLMRICDRLKIKMLMTGFKSLFINSLQQDYQQQLLKARRNLQLVELNYMVQCQIKQIQQNYQQQNQHLESIDKNLSILRQKFTLSRTSGLIRSLKKIIYPQLIDSFNIMLGLVQNRISDSNLYQIQQLGGSISNVSCQSNSNSHIDFMQKFDKTHKQQVKYLQSNKFKDKKKFKRISMFDQDYILEQQKQQQSQIRKISQYL